MKYVLITGGTSGIGYELARCFAKDNWGIVIVGSHHERLKVAMKKLEEEFKVPIISCLQDLSQIGAAKHLYNQIKEKQLVIDTLVNNAGFGLAGTTETIDFNRDEQLMILNNISLVELCKLFLAEMYQRGSGRILNVASTGAFQPGPYTSTYFASKAFVLSYSRAVRYEAKEKGVTVSVLCPGATKTNFFKQEGFETPKSAMSTEKVANYAYSSLMKNKEIIIPGWKNKILPIIPTRLKMQAVANMKRK